MCAHPDGRRSRAGARPDLKRLSDNAAAIPLALAALTIAGAVVRVIFASQDFFADELATYWIVSTNDLGGVIDTVSSTAEITPPLAFSLSWLTAQISLDPEWVRLPAVIAGVATIPLVYLVGMRTAGRAAGLLAAALVTVSPFMIFYSAEARGYGVMMALVLLSTLALLRAADGGGRRWWFAYGLFVVLAAYTHYTSIFVLGAQFLWALWAHPAARKPLLIATGLAALAYVPWLPGLKGDLDSPTTDILGMLSPFDLAHVKLYVGHWLFGFPFSNVGGIKVAGLRDLPGEIGLLLIAGGLLVGAAGLWVQRRRLRAWFGAHEGRIVLLVLLAVATPFAEALASLLSTNIFGTRNLAASTPYVALAIAALATAGTRWMRITAAALLVVGLGFGAAKMLSTSYERPNYTEVADYISAGGGGVVVDGAALTPGPLANFDVESSDPGGEVFRLNIPEENTEPFDIFDKLPEVPGLAERAVAAAGDGRITIVSTVDPTPAVSGHSESELAMQFIEELPAGWELVDRKEFEGFLDLQALVFERRPAPGSDPAG